MNSASTRPLAFLGFGYTAREVLRQLDGPREVWATTRQPERVRELQALGVRPLLVGEDGAELARIPAGAEVVVTFPPRGNDAAWAAALRAPGPMVYVSSTGVYPQRIGALRDGEPAAPDTERGQRRLAAEQVWTQRGAVALRTPAIYGPGRGILERLRAGKHRMVGQGTGRVSRIHVSDLAQLILAALARGAPGAAHTIGDLHPSPQREIIEYICQAEGLPLPESEDLATAPPTLAGDRAVDPTPALEALGVELAFPSYRRGLAPLLFPRG